MTLTRFAFLLVVAKVMMISAPSLGKEATALDRFRLWANCNPMNLVVEEQDKDAKTIGLETDEVTAAVRSRLRAARLFDADSLPYLYVSIYVASRAFSIRVKYYQWMKDTVSGLSGYAVKWSTRSFGTHGDDPTFILSSLSGNMDRFLDEYLRVNASACKS